MSAFIRPITSNCSTLAHRRRGDFGNAADLGAAGARLAAPQRPGLRAIARRRHRRGGAPLRLSLITARLAGEQGREVFAVPGSPLDPRAEGTNGLLKQGAILVTEAADVIAALEPILGRGFDLPVEEPDDIPLTPDTEPGDDERIRIVSLLGPTPSAIDDLVRLSRSSPAVVRTILLELELAGRLERHGGAMVSLV